MAYICHAFSSLQFLCSLPKFKTLSHESVTKGVTAISEDAYSSLGILIQKKIKIQGPELQFYCNGFQDWLQVGNYVRELFFFLILMASSTLCQLSYFLVNIE